MKMLLPQNTRSLLVSGTAVIIVLGVFAFGFQHVTNRDVPSFHNGPALSAYGAERPKGFLGDVFNSTLGFGKIFVINLPYRTDKRDAMSLAASLSELEVEYIPGVKGDTVERKVLPPPGVWEGMDGPGANGSLGGWRAHMNTVREVVERNLSSALVLEDDVDWDIRIKPLMRDFAKASLALTQSTSRNSPAYADPTLLDPSQGQQQVQMDFEDLPSTTTPTHTPYGDNWDVLWVGHCGIGMPAPGDKDAMPLGRVVQHDDETIPEKQWLHFQWGSGDKLKEKYTEHTRVYHHAAGATCSLAYAVSQRGARKILYELGVHQFDRSFDMMLQDACHGRKGRLRLTCLTVQPQLFQHHRARGSRDTFSDITDSKGYNEDPFTRHIRWSTRVNFPKLVAGETDYIDSWPDGGEGFKEDGDDRVNY